MWRTAFHRMKTNKITFTACIFVTFTLGHIMMTGNHLNAKDDKFPETIKQSDDDKQSDTSNKRNHRDLVREEDVKIDIREINSKLDSINKINAHSQNVQSQMYSLTNIDPDVERGERAQALMGEAFHVLDNFIDTNTSETYKGMKSMFSMWNPKSSKVIN